MSDFKIDPSDYLSIDYETFRDDMLELALAQPAQYFQLRKAVLKAVKRQACINQYNIYYLLSYPIFLFLEDDIIFDVN